MSKGWERLFFIFAWIAQGTSYLNPFAYGYMHRMHHANTDKDLDPHSPIHSTNIFSFMVKTWKYYDGVKTNRIELDQRFTKNLPKWEKFELISESWVARLLWVAFYVFVYYTLGANIYLFIFLLPIHFFMGPVHGLIINWFSHKIGYRNFNQSNDSTNLIPIEVLMMGEGLHNNHHYNSNKPNFAHKWFELDPSWVIIKVMSFLRIIKLHPKAIAVL